MDERLFFYPVNKQFNKHVLQRIERPGPWFRRGRGRGWQKLPGPGNKHYEFTLFLNVCCMFKHMSHPRFFEVINRGRGRGLKKVPGIAGAGAPVDL